MLWHFKNTVKQKLDSVEEINGFLRNDVYKIMFSNPKSLSKEVAKA